MNTEYADYFSLSALVRVPIPTGRLFAASVSVVIRIPPADPLL
jgi:hypothetical protein